MKKHLFLSLILLFSLSNNSIFAKNLEKLTENIYDRLYLACEKKDKKAVERILQDKIFDFERAEDLYADGQTLLNYACQENLIKISIMLLESGADSVINRSAEKENITNARWACEHNNLSLLDTLLQYGETDINDQDTLGETPLSWACEHGNTPMVKTLLKHGAEESLNKRLKARPHQTPLYKERVSSTNFKLTQILVENGARIYNDLIESHFVVSMSEEIKTYLKNVLQFDQAKDKLNHVISKIKRNKNKEIPEGLQNIIRLLFCRSTLEYLKQSHVFYKENIFFRLVQAAHEDFRIKNALCTIFNIQDESLLKSENFPELLEYIIDKIELCAAQTKEFQEKLNTILRIFEYRKKDGTERKMFIDKNLDDCATEGNKFNINFIDQTKIQLSKILLNR